jgi:hypothetical protein
LAGTHAAPASANAAITPIPSGSVATPRLRISVDPRVELLSLLFHLAGNSEYNRGQVATYSADIETQFSPFREHPAVRLAASLRGSQGVSYDACMAMAVHVTDAYELKLRIPLAPWPESLDQRWTPESASKFLALARQFVRDSGFQLFVEKHRVLYDTTAQRMQAVVDQSAHLEWFKNYFGERPLADFSIALGLLNGGNCYGPHFRTPGGQEELFCVLGVWQTDAEGLPVFTTNMLDTVVHEFGHSYANPLINRHLAELRTAGDTLFTRVAARMRSQAYGETATMLRESLVRACVIRYVRQYQGANSAARAVKAEIQRGFLWMQELSDLLGDYESHRDRYPTLEAFAPRLVVFFNDYARDFSKRQAVLDAKRPKVLSLTSSNGATDVSSGLTEIRVTFDRPMQDGSWAMCGGGPHFPEITGQLHYDPTRTTFIAPVKLKPGWDYEFGLNCASYDSFRSEQGEPLEPKTVTFSTAKP